MWTPGFSFLGIAKRLLALFAFLQGIGCAEADEQQGAAADGGVRVVVVAVVGKAGEVKKRVSACFDVNGYGFESHLVN